MKNILSGKLRSFAEWKWKNCVTCIEFLVGGLKLISRQFLLLVIANSWSKWKHFYCGQERKICDLVSFFKCTYSKILLINKSCVILDRAWTPTCSSSTQSPIESFCGVFSHFRVEKLSENWKYFSQIFECFVFTRNWKMLRKLQNPQPL